MNNSYIKNMLFLCAVIFLLFSTDDLLGQTVSRQLFGSGGENSVPINPTYYVSYSIGEPVVTTIDASLPILTQGFQQPETVSPLQAGSIILKAEIRNDDIVLRWVDTRENQEQYVVEVWTLGNDWKQIGNTQALIFEDMQPFRRRGKHIRYRISSIGYDGFARTSNVIEFEKSGTSNLRIYPNPASHIIQIEGLKNTHSLQVFDMHGKRILSIIHPGEATSIDVTSWAKGVYVLKIASSNMVKTRKLTVR